jgi:hypothetical protein
MTGGDWFAFAIFGGFLLWWILLPASVIRFYTWFHGEKVWRWGKPRPLLIRLIGIAGLVGFVCVMRYGNR